MTGTTNQGGTFTSTGSNVYIPLISGVDWMRVYNLTQMAASQTTALGVEYFWQYTLPQNSQIAYLKAEAADAANLTQYTATGGGFSYYNNTILTPGTLVSTITAISNASIPVVTNSGTNGLVPGSVVKLINITGGQQLGGIDFTVGYNTLSGTTFSLDYMPEIVAATTGSFRVIPFNSFFYPSRRTIASISQASQAVVVTTVAHSYEIGQTIRMSVPSAMGMVEMDGLLGTIVAVNYSTTVNSFTININSSAFTAFAWPTTGEFAAFTPAEAIPVGEDTADALSQGVDILSDATVNEGSIGIILTGGAGYPGGAADDVLIWEAGTYFNVSA